MIRMAFFAWLMCGFIQANSQDLPAKQIFTPDSACSIFLKYHFPENSMAWSGRCVDGLAQGHGTMIGFIDGTRSSSYTGYMQDGVMHGEGVFEFGNGSRLSGYFDHGELLNLEKPYRARLKKHIVQPIDPDSLYVGDHGDGQLHYQMLMPTGPVRGTIVLLPGTWETTEHVISSTQALCEYASDRQLAVMVLAINQRLVLNDTVLRLINEMLEDAIDRYQLPRDTFYVGGFSMGGLFSLRYAEIAHQDKSKTAVVPRAVFSCDGPVDLLKLHEDFTNKANRTNNHEAQYALNEFNQYLGGGPDAQLNNYVDHSAHAVDHPDKSPARFLAEVPVRIYGDVDPVWWMDHRDVDMYDLNALDQTAMIVYLKRLGNGQATFINAFGKGYRIEGWRHPHSWSIIDGKECVDWLLNLP